MRDPIGVQLIFDFRDFVLNKICVGVQQFRDHRRRDRDESFFLVTVEVRSMHLSSISLIKATVAV
jgi:hypothetical protein